MDESSAPVPETRPYATDLTPDEEDSAWRRFAAEQLLKQYGDANEIYDYREAKNQVSRDLWDVTQEERSTPGAE